MIHSEFNCGPSCSLRKPANLQWVEALIHLKMRWIVFLSHQNVTAFVNPREFDILLEALFQLNLTPLTHLLVPELTPQYFNL